MSIRSSTSAAGPGRRPARGSPDPGRGGSRGRSAGHQRLPRGAGQRHADRLEHGVRGRQPPSTWPLIRNCMAGRCWRSSASATVRPGGGRRGTPAPPRRRGRRWPARRPRLARRRRSSAPPAAAGAPAPAGRAPRPGRRPGPRPPGRRPGRSTRPARAGSPAPRSGRPAPRGRPARRPPAPGQAAVVVLRSSGGRWARTVSRIRS